MFQPGDLVVYGSTGVCRVEEVTTPNLSGEEKDKLYYRLAPLQQSGVIYTPVENRGKIPIRAVLSREEVNALIDEIPSLPQEVFRAPTLQAVSQHYQEAMRTHDCHQLMALVHSVHIKEREAEAQKRHLGMVDERFLKQAQRLLYGEFAVALEMEEENVEDYILDRLGRKEA